MNPREFEKEYNRLLLPLGMYALRMVMNVSEAEDIVQNVFVNVWNHIQEGYEPDNLKSYLYRAVRNAALKYVAKESKESLTAIDEAAEVTEEAVDTSERDARLWQAVNELPPKCREVFLMSKRDNYSYKEIAEALGISIKTVENHLTKAMKSLRKAYGIKDQSITISIFFLPLV